MRRTQLVLVLLVGLAILGTPTAGFAQAARSRPKSAAAPRQWSDVTGKFKIRATLVEQADGQVQLKKTDGSVISVPIEKLSELDRKWLQQQEAAAGEETVGAEWPGFRGPNRNGKGSLCWADDMLYLFSESGGRAALATCSPQGLQIKGEVRVEGKGPSWAHPVVIGGRLYLRYDTNLYCYDVRGQK